MIVHFDITELILSLRRTGIQRVERELIRHWPGPAPLHPCWLDPNSGRLCVLPHEVLSLIAADIPSGGRVVEANALTSLLAQGQPLDPSGLHLFNAELFFDPARTALYTQLTAQDGNRIFWLVYDFLPWLRPQFFVSEFAQVARRLLTGIASHS